LLVSSFEPTAFWKNKAKEIISEIKVKPNIPLPISGDMFAFKLIATNGIIVPKTKPLAAKRKIQLGLIIFWKLVFKIYRLFSITSIEFLAVFVISRYFFTLSKTAFV
jgi:hypothetical protein